MRLNGNDIIMLFILFVITIILFFGCSSLREENQRVTLTAIRILMEKNREIDSLNLALENCRNIKELRVSK